MALATSVLACVAVVSESLTRQDHLGDRDGI